VPYVEAQSDAAFTLWLASLTPGRVLAERHAHLTKPERKILRYVKTNAASAAEKS
jgi:hypothetical protein